MDVIKVGNRKLIINDDKKAKEVVDVNIKDVFFITFTEPWLNNNI